MAFSVIFAIWAQVGVGPMTWDPNLEAFAQNYANQRAGDCALMHSGGGGVYGENIAVGTDLTGAEAVGLWAAEEPNYDYNSNSCTFGQACGHYTQMVWRTSSRLGCAMVQCYVNGLWFVTCNYYPQGNIIGELPY